MPSTSRLRIWDLPTRLFHWLLVACIVALVITGKSGSDAMQWHMRLGHASLALIVFRLVWGLVGGHWSRFFTFIPGPARLLRYLRGQGSAADHAGHNPLGALSVLAMLLIISLQVGSGLLTDDDMFYAGPLAAHAPGAWVELASAWHVEWGQWLLLGIIALHIAALLFYGLVKKQKLIPAMLHGDKSGLPADLPPSRDGMAQRLLALVIAAVCAGLSYAVMSLA